METKEFEQFEVKLVLVRRSCSSIGATTTVVPQMDAATSVPANTRWLDAAKETQPTTTTIRTKTNAA